MLRSLCLGKCPEPCFRSCFFSCGIPLGCGRLQPLLPCLPVYSVWLWPTYKLHNPDLEIPLRIIFHPATTEELNASCMLIIPSGVNSMFQFGKLCHSIHSFSVRFFNRRPGHDQYHRKSQQESGNGDEHDCGCRSLGAGRRGKGGLLHQSFVLFQEIIVAASCVANAMLWSPNHTFQAWGLPVQICIFTW